MKNGMCAWLATASVFIALAGCSTNKTGNNFSLAQVNPFRWIKPESQDKPYPQKPSAFATPGGVPGEKPQDALASTNGKSGGTLYPTPSTQVYPGSSTDYQASLSGQYPATRSQTSVTATAPQGIQPQTGPYDPTKLASASGTSQGEGRQVSWNSANAGSAVATDGVSRSQYPGQYPATSSSAYPVPRAAGATLPGTGSNTASLAGSIGSGTPQYNLAGSRYQVGGATAAGGANVAAATPNNFSANTAASATAARSASDANSDWSTLVGDRYAQVYQQTQQPAWQSSGTPVGNTGYVPGNTGYIPGTSGTPPGSTDYRPGQTGYNPPGLNSAASLASSASGYGQNQNLATSGEYRPGSTTSYVPRSDVGSASQISDLRQNAATVQGSYPVTPYSSQPMRATTPAQTNSAQTTSTGTPFRL